jgi:pimeloyl-ACP methyl ester carboxylesterase
MVRFRYGPENPNITYVPHKYEEFLFDTGEIKLNYALAGTLDKPAVVLIPAQTESWWGYEAAMELLEKQFQVFAVDLRGQGRSSRTPGRYTFDNMGNDLIKFIIFVVKRPVVVSGLSSGGVLAAWLSAYAPLGMIRGALCEDPPLFVSELFPAVGPSVRQSSATVMFHLLSTYLGDQWCIGAWEGYVNANSEIMGPSPFPTNEPPQNLKEYDPEWGKASWDGSMTGSCNHAQMLARVKSPILHTRHLMFKDKVSGQIKGLLSDEQVSKVEELVKSTGQRFTRLDFPGMGHVMHRIDPALYSRTLIDWEKSLPNEEVTRKDGVFKVRYL